MMYSEPFIWKHVYPKINRILFWHYKGMPVWCAYFDTVKEIRRLPKSWVSL